MIYRAVVELGDDNCVLPKDLMEIVVSYFGEYRNKLAHMEVMLDLRSWDRAFWKAKYPDVKDSDPGYFRYDKFVQYRSRVIMRHSTINKMIHCRTGLIWPWQRPIAKSWDINTADYMIIVGLLSTLWNLVTHGGWLNLFMLILLLGALWLAAGLRHQRYVQWIDHYHAVKFKNRAMLLKDLNILFTQDHPDHDE
jgi:hypothetical protein